MHITVKLSPEAAQLLQKEVEAPESQELVQTAKGLGVMLQAMHPGARDPSLRPYFYIEVPDQTAASRVIERFRSLPAVESVYLKPPASTPG